MEQITTNELHKEIEVLKRLVLAMKEEIEDRFLSAEEEILLEESRKESEQDGYVSLEDLEKELNEN